ncbi:MAG: hypothetical protein M3Q76_07085 [Acidobacteriota bacterium]|nr:hypothetical protein [Acidobacteriota bacterium]
MQLNLLSGLMFLDFRKQQAMACGLRHVETRATYTISGLKYLINNRGTIARDAAKNVSRLFGVQD